MLEIMPQAYLVELNGLQRAKTLYDGAEHQQRYSKVGQRLVLRSLAGNFVACKHYLTVSGTNTLLSQHAHGSIIHIAPVPAELDNATIGLVGVTDKGDRP